MSRLRDRPALRMEEEQSHMTELICDLALEIICMLTGEKYAAVKMASIEGLLGGVYPPLSLGGSLTPITKPPSHSRISESKNQKILKVTNRIIELLVGEVSGVGGSEAVCAFMEERRNVEKDQLLDGVMEDHAWVTSADAFSEGNLPERSPHSSHSWDSTQEDQEILHHAQVGDEMIIKEEVKDEVEEADVRQDEPYMEEEASPELPTGSSQEGYSSSRLIILDGAEGVSSGTPHHYKDENQIVIKQEEQDHVTGVQLCKEKDRLLRGGKNSKELVKDGEPCKEEEVFSLSCAGWGLTQDVQEQPCFTYFQEERGSTITSLDVNATSSTLHPMYCQRNEWEKQSSHQKSPAGVKRFPHLSSLEKAQTAEKPYSCPVCGKCFPRLSNLTVHVRTHTGEKPYSCPVCGKCFSQPGHLKIHKITHTGEKPYSCTECGKSFTQVSTLTIHKRIHTGEKPYSCPQCGKSFSRHSNLTKHEKTHTREKLYVCVECGKRFTHLAHLTRHKKSHVRQNTHLLLK